MKRILTLAALWASFSIVPCFAEGPYRNRDNPNSNDPGEGTYPIPYQGPKEAEILENLHRVRAYLEQACPTQVIDSLTGAVISDFSTVNPNATLSRGEQDAFTVFDYTMGVTHSGMLLCAEVSGDARFAAFTERHMRFIAERLPYFAEQVKQGLPAERSAFAKALFPRTLDDSGAMCAGLIKARIAKVGPDLMPQIDRWIGWVHKRQFRLADGTLARQRPQAESLWADDSYMSIPALSQMWKLTGDRVYLEDAVKQMLQMSRHLFNPAKGIFMHGRNMAQPHNPEFYWGRANGWMMLSLVELLEVLPQDHASRSELLGFLGAFSKGLAQVQSGSGLWHQMLDKTDSYLETSASAMFVYGIARAINRGWLSPIGFGSVAQAGWMGITTQINERGQVEGSCVGTTFANDHVYYYSRPASPYATHGYGPVLLAGAEMIRLLKNPEIRIEHRWRTYHYVPKGSATVY